MELYEKMLSLHPSRVNPAIAPGGRKSRENARGHQLDVLAMAVLIPIRR